MIIRINPLDTFFFRDGKPFSAGQDNWADFVFPPSPSVFYGALRTLYLANTIGFDDIHQMISTTSSLKIKGIYLEKGGDLYFPVPNDVVQDKRTNDILLLKSEQNTKGNSLSKGTAILNRLTTNAGVIAENIDSYKLISEEDLTDYYLEGTDIDKISFSENNLVQEAKIGIGRNNQSLTTDNQDGLLYRVEMLRFDGNHINFVIEYEGLELFDNQFIKVGGEGKLSSYKIENNSINIQIPSQLENNKFKLLFTTPTIFKNGWLPDWIDENSLESNHLLQNLKVKLLATSSAKPISIGGFSMFDPIKKRPYPKPMYKAIPSGAVYHFELLEGSFESVVDAFHQKSISEFDTAKEGFGICLVGQSQI